MDSRQRVLRALNHQAADRVPFDLGGTGLTTIHVQAYRSLRRHLNLPPGGTRLVAMAEQLAAVDEDVAERLGTDVRLILPGTASGFRYTFRDEGTYQAYTDEWGIGWRKPQDGGLYYDMYRHPLAEADHLAEFKAYPFPDPLDGQRFANLRAQAEGPPPERRSCSPAVCGHNGCTPGCAATRAFTPTWR
jgi:uroporphyrinogen decarboxylase